MFSITVQGDTLGQLAENIFLMAGQFYTISPPVEATPAPKTKRGKASEPESDPKPAPTPPDEPSPDIEEDDAALEAELNAPAPKAPPGAAVTVDAGTGKPAPTAAAVKQMTMDEVRTTAAKLAAKDSPTLAAILKTYGAGKLSEVAPERLGDFAGEVIAALS